MFPMIFGIIGLIALVICIIYYNYQKNFYENAKSTTAVITGFRSDGDSTTALVTYQVDGQSYTSRLNYYSSTMKRGQEMTVYYDPSNPVNVESKGASTFLIVILLIFAVVFGGFAIAFVLIGANKKGNRQRLKQMGVVIQADITEISENTSMTYNGRHPFIISCQYKAPDGKLYTFASESLWCGSHELPSEGKIPVYVDPRDYTKYYVDIESI